MTHASPPAPRFITATDLADASAVNLWLPTKPLTPTDMINRKAAATGSCWTASLSGDADYNGHPARLEFLPFAMGGAAWVLRYTWAGSRTVCRGSLARCLDAAIPFYDQGERGTSVTVVISDEAPESLEEQAEAVHKADPRFEVEPAHEDRYGHFWTPQHQAVSDAFYWRQSCPDMMAAAQAFDGTADDWESVKRSILGHQAEA